VLVWYDRCALLAAQAPSLEAAPAIVARNGVPVLAAASADDRIAAIHGRALDAEPSVSSETMSGNCRLSADSGVDNVAVVHAEAQVSVIAGARGSPAMHGAPLWRLPATIACSRDVHRLPSETAHAGAQGLIPAARMTCMYSAALEPAHAGVPGMVARRTSVNHSEHAVGQKLAACMSLESKLCSCRVLDGGAPVATNPGMEGMNDAQHGPGGCHRGVSCAEAPSDLRSGRIQTGHGGAAPTGVGAARAAAGHGQRGDAVECDRTARTAERRGRAARAEVGRSIAESSGARPVASTVSNPAKTIGVAMHVQATQIGGPQPMCATALPAGKAGKLDSTGVLVSLEVPPSTTVQDSYTTIGSAADRCRGSGRPKAKEHRASSDWLETEEVEQAAPAASQKAAQKAAFSAATSLRSESSLTFDALDAGSVEERPRRSQEATDDTSSCTAQSSCEGTPDAIASQAQAYESLNAAPAKPFCTNDAPALSSETLQAERLGTQAPALQEAANRKAASLHIAQSTSSSFHIAQSTSSSFHIAQSTSSSFHIAQSTSSRFGPHTQPPISSSSGALATMSTLVSAVSFETSGHSLGCMKEPDGSEAAVSVSQATPRQRSDPSASSVCMELSTSDAHGPAHLVMCPSPAFESRKSLSTGHVLTPEGHTDTVVLNKIGTQSCPGQPTESIEVDRHPWTDDHAHQARDIWHLSGRELVQMAIEEIEATQDHAWYCSLHGGTSPQSSTSSTGHAPAYCKAALATAQSGGAKT
jgi:hypothetical protein